MQGLLKKAAPKRLPKLHSSFRHFQSRSGKKTGQGPVDSELFFNRDPDRDEKFSSKVRLIRK